MRPALAALAILWAGAAAAQDWTAFRSPTGNIHCVISLGDQPHARCDLRQLTPSYPHRPAWCDLDWGSAFGVGAFGPGEVLCHGDTVAEAAAPVLPYGQTLRFGPFACTSRETGMTCLNATGGGFTVARAAQRVF